MHKLIVCKICAIKSAVSSNSSVNGALCTPRTCAISKTSVDKKLRKSIPTKTVNNSNIFFASPGIKEFKNKYLEKMIKTVIANININKSNTNSIAIIVSLITDKR